MLGTNRFSVCQIRFREYRRELVGQVFESAVVYTDFLAVDQIAAQPGCRY